MKQLVKLLKSRHQFRLKSEGFSMQPVLNSGDILYYKKIEFGLIKVNDLIIIYKNNRVITHRVIYKIDNYLVTKGDKNIESDGKIYPMQIIGRVYQIKRNGKIFNPEDIYLIQSSLYFTEIVKIKRALQKEKIDFVFLKGLPLHLFFEGSHPKRIYADCDILISQNYVEKISQILSRYHYKKIDSSLTNTLKSLRNKITEVSYYKILNGFSVIFDIHFEISILINQFGRLEQLYPESLIIKSSNRFLEEKKIIRIRNETFPILSIPNLIIYLGLHFFHHNFRGSYRLIFLDKVIKKELKRLSAISYLQLGNNIRDYKLQNFVYPVFLLLKKYYFTPLPEKFMDSIKPNCSVMSYINDNIVRVRPSGNLRSDPICIFDDETRIQAGVSRFKNLFFLSPNPLWRKLLIIFNLQVIYSVFWVIIFFLRRSFRRSFRSL